MTTSRAYYPTNALAVCSQLIVCFLVVCLGGALADKLDRKVRPNRTTLTVDIAFEIKS